MLSTQLKNPEDFCALIEQLNQDDEAKSDDVLELLDGRVFERHSEPQRVRGKYVGRVWGFRDVTERVRAERRLRALSAAVEQSPVSIVITDLQGNIEYVNRHFCDLSGYSSEEALGRNPSILKSGETPVEEYRQLWETISSGRIWRGTFHNKRKNGELYWESATIRAIRDASGAPARYLAIKEDITRHRLAVEALQASERRYRGLFEHMLEGVVYGRMVFENGQASDFVYLAVNGAFESLTGLKDVLGKRVTEVIPGIRETDQALLDAYGRVASSGRPEKMETYVAALQMWWSISLYCPEEGVFAAVFDVITERKRAEEALQKSREQYMLAVKGSNDAIWDWDIRNDILFLSPQGLRMIGYQDGELANAPSALEDRLHPDDAARVREQMRLYLAGEIPHYAVEFRLRHKDGSYRWILARAEALRDEKGAAYRMAGSYSDITERKRAEEALYLTQTAMDRAPASVIWLDQSGHVVYVNEAASLALGYSIPELLTMKVWDFDPNLSEELWQTVWAELQACDSWDFEVRHRNKAGKIFPVEVSAKYIEFGGKKIASSFTRDITERRRIEDELRISQERFRIAAENASDVVFEMDLDSGRIQYFGDQLKQRYPNAPFPATLEEWLPVLHPDDLSKITAAVQVHQATGQPLHEEYRMLQTDGSVLHAEIRAAIVRDSVTGRLRAIGAVRDITQQKASERTNAELAAIVRCSDAAIIQRDRSGRILTWNSGAERLYGYSATEMIGRDNSILLPPEGSKKWADIERALEQGSEINYFETTRITKAGERLDVLVTASPVRDGAGNIVGSADIGWNITERKRLERQLAQAQKLESIGQLAAGIAHEINTPIQYIGDNVKFLGEAFEELFEAADRWRQGASADGGAPRESAAEDGLEFLRREAPMAIAELEQGVAQVSRIVGAMKEFSHPGQVEKRAIDLNRALDSVIVVSKNEWKYVAEMKRDFDPELPLVPCVAGEINQVFLNLVINAAHAIGDAVPDKDHRGVITISTRRNGDWAEVRVRDTGTGIPEAIRARVFDPFFTTKEVGKGTGQGLSIAHAVVVQKHRGAIEFESSVGVGTTFLVRLPLDALN